MSLLLQIAIGVLVAGGLGFGVWTHQHNKQIANYQQSTTQEDSTSKSDTNASVNAGISLTTGTTTADLTTDLGNIDAQLRQVDDSSVSIDQSINDKPIDQN